jgi:mevalonate kinase
MVETVLARVEGKYRELHEFLRNQGLHVELEPRIEVIDITPVQQQQFTRLAERRLIERLDISIDNVSRLIDSIAEITEEARRRTLRYRLTRLGVEWRTIQGLASELGIRLTEDFRYLIDLIDEAIRRVS